jgi:hypothetical protein
MRQKSCQLGLRVFLSFGGASEASILANRSPTDRCMTGLLIDVPATFTWPLIGALKLICAIDFSS